MEKRTMKIGQWSLLLVMSCLVLAGCADIFNPPNKVDRPVEAGYGRVNFNMVGDPFRTIFPAKDILIYDYSFSNNGGPLEIIPQNTDGSFTLESGVPWTVYVSVYAGEIDTDKLAAFGSGTFTLVSGGTVDVDIVIEEAPAGDGLGTFSFNIQYPEGTAAVITMEKLPDLTASIDLGVPGSADFIGTVEEIPAGFYLLTINLHKDGKDAGKIEVVHIYNLLTTEYGNTVDPIVFTDNQFIDGNFVDPNVYFVTSNADTGAGSLREAINSPTVLAGSTIVIDSGVGTINLASGLTINKSLTIRGNGVTIRNPTINNLRLVDMTTVAGINVHISGVHFAGGRFGDYGAGIRNGSNNTLTLESCIFSDNRAVGTGSQGGAISCAGTLIVRGCTFYNNSSGSWGGGAIDNTGGSVTMIGNLFYGNTSTSGNAGRSRVLAMNGGTYNAAASGYNVVDIAFGTAASQAGWVAAPTDRLFSALGISGIPFNTTTFVPVSGLSTMLPASYLANFPIFDFYGNKRAWPGAPGAVNFGMIHINIAAIRGIPVPVVGFAPVTLINETNQYTGTVTWEPNDPVFEAGIPYTATITLTAINGFTVEGVAANFFTVTNAESVTNAAGSGIITAVFPLPLLPPAMVNRNGGAETAYPTLAAALNAITTAGNYTVTISEDQSLAPWTINTTGVHITLIGNSEERKINLSSNGRMFYVSGSNVSLTLGNNITLVGRSVGGNGNQNNNNCVVYVDNGASFTMLDDSKVTGNTSTGTAAGTFNAVSIATNSAFIMRGGAITGNSAPTTGNSSITGGLYVAAPGASAIIEGGSITGNTGVNNDVFVTQTVASFTVSGDAEIGTITLVANATSNASLTIASDWDGHIGTLNLYGNNTNMVTTISYWENIIVLRAAADYTLTAADVAKVTLGNFITSAADSATQAISSTYHIANSGADIGRLVIPPVMVSRNGGAETAYPTLTAALGAIIIAGDYTVTISGDQSLAPWTIDAVNMHITLVGTGRERSINLDSNGIMFNVSHSTASLTLGDNITLVGRSGNSDASSVVRLQNGARLTMLNGSKITGNTTNIASGVRVENGCHFIMLGGSITGNTATSYADGVFVASSMEGLIGTFIVSGNAIVDDVVLNFMSPYYPSVTINAGWTGNIGTLNLRRGTADINSVIASWEGEEVLKAASGYTLTTGDVAKILSLGMFLSTSDNTQPISPTYRIADSGVDIGRLVANNP
ncbi:MAG: hypothetical protein FWD36_01765 [Treponema sp.]|nr:hypothetical protein [Treponema sp.]